MKYQVLFSLTMEKYSRLSSAAVMTGILSVKILYSEQRGL